MLDDVSRIGAGAHDHHSSQDPRAALIAVRNHLGLAEGHIVSIHRLLRILENLVEERDGVQEPYSA